jgi:uncharacterized delta-60 repeat protein
VIFYVTDEAFTCGPELSDICNYLEAAPIDWNGGTGDPSRSWVADYENDNHILFRLNPDGSYDPEFGDEALYLRTDEDDEDLKPYALVTTTCSGYTERLDLAIDSLDRILVLLSGSAEENTCQGEFNNFVARFTATGALDMSFGDDSDGAIGTLNSQEGPAEDLFADLTLDAEGRIIVAALSEEDSARMGIVRFSQNGIVDLSFGNLGTSLINLYLPDDNAWLFYRSISMIANDDESYIIGFAGSTFENDSQSPIFYTQLLRLEQNGTLDEDFLLPEGISVAEGVFVLPYVFLTDLAPDSETGFIMSATAYPPIGGEGGFFEAASSVAFRIQMDGNFDAEFLGTPSDPNLAPLYSASCFNSVLLRDYLSHRSSDGIIVGNFCDDNVVPEEKYKLFSSTGVFQGQYSLNRAPELAEQVTNQLIQTSDDKVIVLSGLRPTTGIFGFMDAFGGFFDETDWTQSRITRYVFSNLSTPPTSNPLTITPSRATVNGQVGLAITPLDFTIAGGASADYARLSVNPALPAGLEFADGQIIGTPTAAGTTTVIFIVTDSEEGTTTATTTVQFVITLANQRPSTTSPSRVTGTVGTSLGNSVTLSLGGATSSETVTVTSGYALPAGLSLATNGRVTGTPSAAGTTSTRLTFTNTQSETATALIEFVIAPAYIPPSPVAYVRALTTPQIQLSSGKLLCAPGTYNAGYALEGVIMGSSTVLFSPTSFTYALLINGVKQSSSQISTAANSVFWDLPVSPSGTLFTCSVTVSYNGASTTNNSSDNSAAANTARTAQATSIANASTTYSSALVQNTKAYEKALKDNRSNWRAEMEKIKATYYAERDRIKALPASKETSAARSASLKTYLSAQKKSAVDYAASKPAALAAKDAADKAAMMAKDAAIAKANTTYANVIQSIGFGVLIP